jgi:hypothetical protein
MCWSGCWSGCWFRRRLWSGLRLDDLLQQAVVHFIRFSTILEAQGNTIPIGVVADDGGD